MDFASTLNPNFVSVMEETVALLRFVADDALENELQQRMRELGEKREACTPEEREEHRQLAEFWRKQTLRKLRAMNVLQRLRETAPELVRSLPGVADEQ